MTRSDLRVSMPTARTVHNEGATKGYFRSSPLQDQENDRVLGELYAETLFYEDVVDRARKRISVYKDRLQVDVTRS